jgi:hypothetical protein
MNKRLVEEGGLQIPVHLSGIDCDCTMLGVNMKRVNRDLQREHLTLRLDGRRFSVPW